MEDRKEKDIIELVIEYLENRISEENKKIVEEWCRESENHQFEFNKVKDTLRLTSRYQKMQNIDSIKAKRKVKKQIPEFNPNMSFIQVWQKLAAILLLPLLTGGILLYFFSGHHSEMNNYREITTSYGTRTKIDLPDGSHVWLNSGSTIRFPDKFAKDQRVVKIEGEALFDIITDKNRPFYVDLGELSVKATGTTFNVAAYPEENIFETTLIDGIVNIVKKSDNSAERVIHQLKPNQHLVYNKKNKSISLAIEPKVQITDEKKDAIDHESIQMIKPNLDPILVKENKYTSWVNGKLIFRNDSMEYVIKRLERWYNAEIELQDSLLYDFKYTATFTNETLEQVLEMLALSAPVHYSIEPPALSNDKSFISKKIKLGIKKY